MMVRPHHRDIHSNETARNTRNSIILAFRFSFIIII